VAYFDTYTLAAGDPPVCGPIFWARILDFDAGAQWAIENGKAQVVKGLHSVVANRSKPWSDLRCSPSGSGGFTVMVGRDPDVYPGPEGSQGQRRAAVPSGGGKISNAAGTVQLGAGAGCAVVSIQNTGTSVLRVSLYGSFTGAAALAFWVLAPASAADAGDGGSVIITGYTGTIYAGNDAAAYQLNWGTY
jgi:hypothetical protein